MSGVLDWLYSPAEETTETTATDTEELLSSLETTTTDQTTTGDTSTQGTSSTTSNAEETLNSLLESLSQNQEGYVDDVSGEPIDEMETALDTLSSFLTGERFDEDFNAQYQSAADDVVEDYVSATIPTINATFGTAGRTGSGAMQDMYARSQEELGDSLSNLASDVYGQELDAMLAALGLTTDYQETVTATEEAPLDQYGEYISLYNDPISLAGSTTTESGSTQTLENILGTSTTEGAAIKDILTGTTTLTEEDIGGIFGDLVGSSWG